MVDFKKLLKRFLGKNKKILIVVGGKLDKIEAFRESAKKLELDVTLASFSDLKYTTNPEGGAVVVKINDTDLAIFDVIYIRMVGKRVEDAALMVDYAVQNQVQIVDKMYINSRVFALSLVKSLEMKKLVDAGLPLPKTLFGSLETILTNGEKIFGFPFVIKSTTGRRAREVWIVENKTQLKEKIAELTPLEKSGIKYFAQEFIKASQRIRVLTVGGHAIAAITRPTKWRKRFIEKVNGEFPEGIKNSLNPIPAEYEALAIAAANATGLDICGVDILVEDGTEEIFVIEANAAPAWELIKKDTDIIVEEEILNFLNS